MASRRGQRRLTPEERNLWAHVTRHDQRLTAAAKEREVAFPAPEPVTEIAPSAGPAPQLETKAATPPAKVPRQTGLPTPALFDARLARRIARGQKTINARLDLHGMRQHDAYTALRSFLVHAQAAGHRQVLVITGKGGKAGDDENAEFWLSERRGVLRRLVPIWLAQPDFRLMVVSHKEAAPHHGGSGALYIAIRRSQN